MVDQTNPDQPIEDSFVFDLEMSEKGRRLNRLAEWLVEAANRETFKADPEKAMDLFDLTETEKKLITDNDWLNIGKAGCNVYGLMRIASVYGVGLYPMGAQQLGMSYEEFLETRNAKGAT